MKKIIFFGTPEFAAINLKHLLAQNILVVGVVTQPDRPKGRSLQMTASAVKAACPENIPVLQPNRASEADFLDKLRALGADLYVVVAFGQILPQKLLDIPPLGCINVHASLLPKYRGAAPIQRAILHGEKETGVCVQKMVRELDAGDVIDEARMAISDEMNFGELESGLCELSKNLLVDVIHRYEQGVPKARSQDPSLVTFAPKITPEELKIDWNKPNVDIHNQIRAFSPRPGAWAQVVINGEMKRLKILSASLASRHLKAGEAVFDQKIFVGCGSGSIQIHALQLEGKPKMHGEDWARGFKVFPADLFV